MTLWRSYSKPQSDGSRVISLIVAKDDKILPALLMAPQSSQLFALSHNHIYCLYPNLFARKEFVAIRNDNPQKNRRPFGVFNFGLTGRRYYVGPRECGETCPLLWRRALGDGKDGIGIFRWKGFGGLDRDGGGDAMFDQDCSDMVWRVASQGRCDNPFCPNYQRSLRLETSH